MASPDIVRILNATLPNVSASLMSPKLSVDLLRLIHVGFSCRLLSDIKANVPLDIKHSNVSEDEIAVGRLLNISLRVQQGQSDVANLSHQFLIRKFGLSAGRLKTHLERNLDASKRACEQKADFSISKEECEQFAENSGNHNPIYFDGEFAQLAGLSRPVVALPLLLKTVLQNLLDEGTDFLIDFCFIAVESICYVFKHLGLSAGIFKA